MRNNEYTFDSKVRISESDAQGRLTLPAIINYFQDCSTLQSESYDLGVGHYKKYKRAWVLSSWQIEVKRYPKLAEDIKVRTWATSFNGLFGERNFCIEDKAGKMLAWANSLWVYMDMAKGRPVKPFPEEIEPYGESEPLEMDKVSRKIKLPENAIELESFRVKRFQIDTNLHMNNSQYVMMAAEYLEKDFVPGKVRVEYKKSAMYDDVIIPKIAEEETRIVVELCDTEGKPYALIEFGK